MKHVKKKFLKKYSVGEDVIDAINSAPVDENATAQLKQQNYEGYYAILQTEGKELIQAFQYNTKGKPYFIPEPNPIVIYFEVGRYYLKAITDSKQSFFGGLDRHMPNAYETLNNFYVFYTNASVCATFLFNAIEAFINNLIPNDYTFSKVLDRKTETYDKFQIQRHLPLEEKIKKVLPEIKGKSFHIEYGHKYENIDKLKTYRDEIMHTKSYDSNTNPNFYKDLFTTSLNFDYETTILCVRDFINYYEPNLIEECDCGKDW